MLVFVIVASALAQGSSKLDRRFGTVIWLYMLTTFLAAAIAVVTSFIVPGHGRAGRRCPVGRGAARVWAK